MTQSADEIPTPTKGDCENIVDLPCGCWFGDYLIPGTDGWALVFRPHDLQCENYRALLIAQAEMMDTPLEYRMER